MKRQEREIIQNRTTETLTLFTITIIILAREAPSTIQMNLMEVQVNLTQDLTILHWTVIGLAADTPTQQSAGMNIIEDQKSGSFEF